MPPPWPEALACQSVNWLEGDASTRRYARLERPRRHPVASAMLMVFVRGTPAEEVRRVLRATELLARARVPVPDVFDSCPEQRWILQEDLGDVSLAHAIRDGADPRAVYPAALAVLDHLVGLQLDTSPHPPLGGTRLRDELEHFARGAVALEHRPGPALAADLDRLVEACLEPPTRLCHRDFHARNLFLKEGRVRVIDHQDALPGPGPYDRVSLAYDPYVALDDTFRDVLAGNEPGTSAVATQRLAKAIGTYAHLGGRWQRWIAPAARQARRLMARDKLALPVLDAALAPLALATVS